MLKAHGLTPTCLALALLFPACHETPSLGGASLECTVDSDCAKDGEGWRCYKSGCIRNTPPTVALLDTDYIALASPPAVVTKSATATDPEGDAITFTWTAAPGPAAALLPAPLAGATLTVTPSAVGIYEFDVIANDGYADSAAVRYRFVVQPDVNAVYVSTTGTDLPDCGTVDAPCASITYAATIAHTRPGQRILVAAASGNADYAECLDLDGDLQVTGCFDPQSWSYLEEQRDRCIVRCDKPNGTAAQPTHPSLTDLAGHVVRGNVLLADLFLVLDPSVTPVKNPNALAGKSDSYGIVSLLVASGAPRLDDVDVRVADCGAGCSAVGVGSVYASPTLSGVDIFGAIEGFDPMRLFIGAVLYGGSPTMVGDPNHATPRGEVLMNLPTTEAAMGIVTAVSQATLSGIAIRGGFAPTLAGVNAVVGQTTVENVEVELTGLGAHALYGIIGAACTPTSDGPDACSCAVWYPDCPTDEPTPPAPTSLTLTNTRVRVAAPSGSGAGLRPCSGVGLQVAAEAMALTMDGDANPGPSAGSRVDVGDDFTLGAGLVIQANGPDAPGFSVKHTIVSVGSAEVDDVCYFQAVQQGNTDFPGGALGMAVGGGTSGTLEANSVTVGANESLSLGLALFNAATVSIVGNEVAVADSAGRVLSAGAAGILVSEDTSTALAPSTLAANRVIVGADAASGSAVSLGGSPFWTIRNNFINGGGAFQSVGMFLGPTKLDPAFPMVEQNTITGGGDRAKSATSRGLQLVAPAGDALGTAPSGVIPVFSNNLIDAGNAHGRRFVLDDYAKVPFGTGSAGNRGQFDDAAVGPRPEILIPGTSSYVGAPTAGTTSYITWWTLASNSSELLSVSELAPSLASEPTTMLLSDSIPLEGPVLTAWTSRLRLRDWLLVSLPGSLALAQVESGARPVFETASTATYSPGSAAPSSHTPTLLAAAYANQDTLLDLLFVDQAGLWVLYRDPAHGFNPPTLLEATAVGAPITALAVDPDGNFVLALKGDKLELLSPANPPADGLNPTLTLTAMPVSVKAVLATTFGEEAATGTNDKKKALDVVVLAEATAGVFGVDVYFNPFGGGSGKAPYNPVGEPPCGVNATGFGGPYPASTPTAVWVDELVPAIPDHGRELLIGCADGRVEMFRVGGTSTPYDLRRFAVPATASPPTPVSAIMTNAFDLAHARRIAVTRGSANSVTSYYIEQPSTYAVTERLRLTMTPDSAWRDPTDGQLKATFAGGGPVGTTLQPAVAGTPRACDFVGGSPYDLHRGSDSDAACKSARLSDVTSDIDGGARRDPTDIGADEFGAP